ncbi:MAG: nucleoside deaminase [Eubacteriales bacterium]|nr:nucleoside deaminase [Eubacteriales bacterium]
MSNEIQNKSESAKKLASTEEDRLFMTEVLALAQEAAAQGEIPVAAILVESGQILARAANSREKSQNPLGHAEVLCLMEAAEKTGRRFFPQASLYCNLEPCLMCLGAIIQARVGRLVYAAADQKGGAAYLLEDPELRVNHRPELQAGLLAEESSQLLKSFFRSRRQINKHYGGRGARRILYEKGYTKPELINQKEPSEDRAQLEE